jgi:hypothetical protein
MAEVLIVDGGDEVVISKHGSDVWVRVIEGSDTATVCLPAKEIELLVEALRLVAGE